ncbi:MAG TPA: M50 family metallopeptidase [Candidatus Saccharibacteria bacterium]|nr:M50 family metallopeptidase [Candidatus Saccharibacteria bacterium]HRK94339.1 M50 family metallopeptidase [Candidatus Saccharibacteria bacterium]
MLLIGILTGLIILVLLVVIHELGHAIVARRNGVVVEEFGIGFPPKAWAKKLKQSILGKNVLLSINWLPLGGFVKLQGEHDSADKPGDYGKATYWQKTKILLAGVLMNWVAAAVIFTLLAFVGLPKVLPNQFSVPSDTKTTQEPLKVATIENNSPAKDAGLKVNDEILLINGNTMDTSTELSDTTKANRGKTVQVTYSRSGNEATVPVTLRGKTTPTQGYLGVRTSQRLSEIQATWSAPIVGVGTTIQLTGETFKGLGNLVANLAHGIGSRFSGDEAVRKAGDQALGDASASVSGPVGILGVIFPQMQQAGLKPLLLLTAIISLSLAVMNVLPIPALDGGRWFTMTVFRLLKKPLTKEREEKIQTIGFMVLLGLIVLVTVADVGKLFG